MILRRCFDVCFDDFFEEHKDEGYTKFQLQLKLFMRYQKRFHIHFYQKISRKSFEKEIDEFFSNIDIIRRFGGTNTIKPYKAFVKKGRFCNCLLS